MPTCTNVFDLWAQRWRRREAVGDMIILRYADDIVVGFEREADARRFWDTMRERLREFALSLHPDKTHLLAFGRFAAARRERCGLGKPETFDFLGFTMICGKSRSGGFLVRRKSRRDRMQAKLEEIKEGLRRRRHQPLPEQGTWLKRVVTGYFAYHAVPTNNRALGSFRYHVAKPLAPLAAATQPAEPHHVGSDGQAGHRLAPQSAHPSSLAASSASPSNTRGGSRMRECCTYGSVLGAPGNGRSYRVTALCRHGVLARRRAPNALAATGQRLRGAGGYRPSASRASCCGCCAGKGPWSWYSASSG